MAMHGTVGEGHTRPRVEGLDCGRPWLASLAPPSLPTYLEAGVVEGGVGEAVAEGEERRHALIVDQ